MFVCYIQNMLWPFYAELCRYYILLTSLKLEWEIIFLTAVYEAARSETHSTVRTIMPQVRRYGKSALCSLSL